MVLGNVLYLEKCTKMLSSPSKLQLKSVLSCSNKVKELPFLLVGPWAQGTFLTFSLSRRRYVPATSRYFYCSLWTVSSQDLLLKCSSWGRNFPPADVPQLPARLGQLPSPHWGPMYFPFTHQCDHWNTNHGLFPHFSSIWILILSSAVLTVPPSCTWNNNSLVPSSNHERKPKRVSASGSCLSWPPFPAVNCW